MISNGALALESGEVFYGKCFGAEGEAFGEAVFNTSMSGYQEILTDPSYKGQIIAMTYPEIGNYGVNDEDNESSKIHASGFIVKNYSKIISNFRSTSSLSDFLRKYNIIGLEGIDTRKLTRILRLTGSKKAVISTTDFDADSLVAKAKASLSITEVDLVKQVSTDNIYIWKQDINPDVKITYKIAVYDFGVKWNILRCLAARGAELKVFPADTDPEKILDWNPDGIFLSNGPGDPRLLTYAVDNVKKLLGKKPIFGICFGHQILTQAYGGSIYKLKFGHRGGNQPAKDLNNKTVEITSQNHGFAAKNDVDCSYTVTHINPNDDTVEGLEVQKDNVFSVQYHPEASPGPHDSYYLFDKFIKNIDKNRT
jgi:carbamoyl-phosphate synthase small subunit